MRWAGHVEIQTLHNILGKKTEEKIRLGKSRNRWRIILKWILGKQGVGGVD
jgi:hypothetical protein